MGLLVTVTCLARTTEKSGDCSVVRDTAAAGP